VLSRFISCQLSSIAFFLVLASVYEPMFLTQTKLIGDWNALVVLGCIGTILAGLRKVVPSERTVYEPKKNILDLSTVTHYYPKRWIGNEHTEETYQEIFRLYPYSVLTFFWEMLGIFLAPLQMIFMARNADAIIEYMRDNTVQLNKTAVYCKHGCFQKKKDATSTSVIHQYPYKVIQSMINFKMEYPSWNPPDHLLPFFEHTSQLVNSTMRESYQEYKSDTTPVNNNTNNNNNSKSGILGSSGSAMTFRAQSGSTEKQKERFAKTLFGFRIDESLGNDSL